jgi:hypothetical protein
MFQRSLARVGVFASAVLLATASARAQNTTSGANYGYIVGQGPISLSIGDTVGLDTERWYTTGLTEGKSYCFETFRNTSDYNVDLALLIDLHQVAGGAVGALLNSFDSMTGDPSPGFNSRWTRGCEVAPATQQQVFVRIHRSLCCTGRTGSFQFRILETTLHAPWWFVSSASGYDAFIELANTTTVPVAVTVTVRSASGTTLGANTTSIPAGGNIAMSVANQFGGTITANSGSAQVAHDGPPGAIVGNITTLSGATGLSFDSPFGMRDGFK